MSHFSVMVIGQNVEAQLQPYHEFECTGTDDEHVQDIDITDKARREFDADTSTCLKDTAGNLHSFFDDDCKWRPEFSQLDPRRESWDANRRTYFVPDGYEKVEVPASMVRTFADWAEGYHGTKPVAFGSQPDLTDKHKYGYCLLDEKGDVLKVVRRTNPNKTWDWWVVGGRWSGFLKLKAGAGGELGRRGLMGSCYSEEPNRADVTTKGAIDFDGMRGEAASKAADEWDKAAAAKVAAGFSAETVWDSWETVRARHPENIEAARDEYHAQPAMKAVKEALDIWGNQDKLLAPRSQYIEQQSRRAVSPYALVMDGKWYAKGRMGWFGCSFDEQDQAVWDAKVNELLDSLPDDTPITIVDCHI